MNPDTWAFDTHARLQDGRPSCLSLTLCHCHGRRTHLGLIRGCGYREPCGSAGQATIGLWDRNVAPWSARALFSGKS